MDVDGCRDYKDVRPGVILSAVQRAKSLNDLHLSDVRIKLTEKNAIILFCSCGILRHRFSTKKESCLDSA